MNEGPLYKDFYGVLKTYGPGANTAEKRSMGKEELLVQTTALVG